MLFIMSSVKMKNIVPIIFAQLTIRIIFLEMQHNNIEIE